MYRPGLEKHLGSTVTFTGYFSGKTRMGGGRRDLMLRHCLEKPVIDGEKNPFSDHVWIRIPHRFGIVPCKGDCLRVTGYVDYYERKQTKRIGLGIKDVENIEIISAVNNMGVA